MLVDDLIKYLNDVKDEFGNMEVCVLSECLSSPSSSMIVRLHKDDCYYNVCEEFVRGDFLLLE